MASLESTMTLPFDFTTSLWLTSVPVWEWEPSPEPPERAEDSAGIAREGGAEVSAAASSDGPANFDAMHGTASSPTSGRPGYRLMFRGYEISGHVFWYPADSPMARPWVAAHVDAHADTDHRPRRRDEPELLPPVDAVAYDPSLRADRKDGTA
jgi:hypothetical protein